MLREAIKIASYDSLMLHYICRGDTDGFGGRWCQLRHWEDLKSSWDDRARE